MVNSQKKVPKQKTCPVLRKWVISDCPLLNCITARKCEILYSITTKNELHHQKAYKNLHIRLLYSFFISQIAFSNNPYCDILVTFKTSITRRLFEESENCLKVLYADFCTFSDDANHFDCN